jgi:hypothetical protein
LQPSYDNSNPSFIRNITIWLNTLQQVMKKKWEKLLYLGRAIAQAVSHWLPTAAARVRLRAAYGLCGGQSGTGQVFSEYFCFPCQSVHQFLRHHNRPGLAQ